MDFEARKVIAMGLERRREKRREGKGTRVLLGGREIWVLPPSLGKVQGEILIEYSSVF